MLFAEISDDESEPAWRDENEKNKLKITSTVFKFQKIFQGQHLVEL